MRSTAFPLPRPTASPPFRPSTFKQDALRYLAAFVLFSLVVIPFWNRGPVFLPGADIYGRAMILEGRLAGKSLDATGISRLHRYVTSELRPSYNPFAIIKHHLRYRHHREAYTFVVGAGEIITDEALAPAAREFALYQSGNEVYLRIEPLGFNRVLIGKLDPEAVESFLEPYILD